MRAINASLLSLLLVSVNVQAKDDTPSAMNKPVDSTTTPAATTGKSVEPNKNADNSVRNNVHDGEHAVSADQQSNDKGDIEITRKIRQAVVKEKSFSIDAQNVKIITSNGSVVLKGPVASNEEKAKVEAIAAKVAGKNKMVSEIEVKAK